jgi:hypothetical protein
MDLMFPLTDPKVTLSLNLPMKGSPSGAIPGPVNPSTDGAVRPDMQLHVVYGAENTTVQ